MKYLNLPLLLLLLYSSSFCQETVKRKKYLFGNLVEKYEVLKNNKRIRHGKAYIYKGTVLLASGAYENNQRSGRWIFFSPEKKVEQIYNYSTKTLKGNKPGKMLTYDIPAEQGDTVQNPALIGGISTGIPIYMEQFFASYRPSQSNINCDLYFLFHIDRNGSLEKWEYKLRSAGYNDEGILKFAKIPEELVVFSPAFRNGKPVSSTIIYKTRYYTKTSTVITSISTRKL